MATLVKTFPVVSSPPAETKLADAAAKLGELLLQQTSKRGDALVIGALKDIMKDLLDGARELGAAQREVVTLRRYSTKVEEANSRLMQIHSAAHAEREQLVRDLAPALDVIADVFNRARQLRDSLAPSARPYVPPPPATPAEALDGYRASSIEAHHEV